MQSNKGFTIIELIVVIAIIATLSSIVMVNVSGYINKKQGYSSKIKLGFNKTLRNRILSFSGRIWRNVHKK